MSMLVVNPNLAVSARAGFAPGLVSWVWGLLLLSQIWSSQAGISKILQPFLLNSLRRRGLTWSPWEAFTLSLITKSTERREKTASVEVKDNIVNPHLEDRSARQILKQSPILNSSAGCSHSFPHSPTHSVIQQVFIECAEYLTLFWILQIHQRTKQPKFLPFGACTPVEKHRC